MSHHHHHYLWILLVLVGVVGIVSGSSSTSLTSPCPRIFTYQQQQVESDRWYGVLTLFSKKNLNGVWLRLTFDQHILQIGNWFGSISRLQSDEYEIRKATYRIKAHQPYTLRFFVKYDADVGPAPQLLSFKLNGKKLCPEDGVSNVEDESSINGAIPIEPMSGGNLSDSISGSGVIESTIITNKLDEKGDDDDDAFAGDLEILNQPESGPREELKCGAVLRKTDAVYTYGHPTHPGEFPWHAALYLHSPLRYICGATLISTKHIITAAHCVTQRDTNTPLDPQKLRVYLGKYHLSKFDDVGLQEFNASHVYLHVDYNWSEMSNDLGMVKLDKEVVMTKYVRPVCVWGGDPYDEPLYGFYAGTVVGWGFSANNQPIDQLMQTKMPAVHKTQCLNVNRPTYSKFTASTTYCAGFRNGTAVCNADSGSGMVFPITSESTVTRGVFQLRGVVSLSVALQKNVKCGGRHYTVFTDVARYLDWINEKMKL